MAVSYTVYNGGSAYPSTGNVTISTVGGGGAGGTGYTINTGAGINGTWATSYNNNWDNASVKIDTKGIDIKQGSDLVIGGVSLTQFIKNIEDRLAILHPNAELEDKWEQLKDLRRQYEALEKDILEKEKLMKILKEK